MRVVSGTERGRAVVAITVEEPMGYLTIVRSQVDRSVRSHGEPRLLSLIDPAEDLHRVVEQCRRDAELLPERMVQPEDEKQQ